MGVFSKLFTALRGSATEVGEAIVDTQALRILDQEMRDSRKNLDEAKENLTKVIAEQIGVEREVNRLKKKLGEYEGYAVQALDKGDEALAGEIAEKMAELENDLEAQQSVLNGYNDNIRMLKKTIRGTERNIKSMEREISVVKTTSSVQKANEAAAAKFSGTTSSLRSATDSLERIKKKQQKKSDQMAAAMRMQQQESGGDLRNKLKAAGIVAGSASSNSILDRLKAKRKGSVAV
ncbi:MAG: PspA/IM30 family protein [Gammaproteobacteria bacterium]|nr:PspA/IM30 family protein [Gammaproteobacteria bacterium]